MGRSGVWVGGEYVLGFFENKKFLTLQHFSAADQKSSCLEQHLSSSPLHIVPFKKSKSQTNGHRSLFPLKGGQAMHPRVKICLLHTTRHSLNTHCHLLPPALLPQAPWKQYSASGRSHFKKHVYSQDMGSAHVQPNMLPL